MNEKLLFDLVRELCVATGKGIDKISKLTGNNPRLVAKLYKETFEHILEETEKAYE